MRPEDVGLLPEQTQEKVCQKHGVPKPQSPTGNRTCAICEIEEMYGIDFDKLVEFYKRKSNVYGGN